jgi:serine/threonine-protein kinase
MPHLCDSQTCKRFTEGLLSEAEEEAYIAHLDVCRSCQCALESAAADPAAWETARELLPFSREEAFATRSQDDTSEGLLTQLANSPLLSLLAPSDDPRMIGRIGPYDVIGVLGRGGFGLVLKGYDSALSRNVAIKVLDPGISSLAQARERFGREARAMAAISHDHVVPVYAVDVHRGIPYFVMEYVPGGSLEQRLSTHGSFDVLSIVRIGLQVAQALTAAHQQGLVHRDIKPGNVLLDRGIERVRVADFGLARLGSDVTSTHSGTVAGTPQYMSPEQVRGETCDAQSDLFSLGSLMYALCTGHSPFRAPTIYGTMQRIVHDAPRPIREQNPQVPLWLEQLVNRLMEKSRVHRLASSREVCEILHAELAHLQNPAQHPEPRRSWHPRKPQFWRWSKEIAISSVAALLFVAILALQRPTKPIEDAPAASPLRGDARSLMSWNDEKIDHASRLADQLEHEASDALARDGFNDGTNDIHVVAQRLSDLKSQFNQELILEEYGHH